MTVCPSCGHENAETNKFCGECAAPLGAPARPVAEERKVVSILFVDLVGFTASSDRADPEDVRARLRPYQAMLKREIERYGGIAEKFIGDAVMAVFGAPVAHEDDAERAVRSALRIIEAIRELNEELPGLELSVRAAVNTGEAVVALRARPERGEGIVTGDVVNTASRLQGVAPAGGVVVGEVTYRATKDAIEYEALAAVVVKGKDEPIPIWHATRARSRFTPEIERAATPFIGRANELGLLQQTYARAVRGSSVQLVTVTGEPGVGKSRLTGEFFAWIDDQPEIVSWRHGRCLSYGEGITFWALGEIVKAQAGILESDPPEEAASKLAESVDAVLEEESEREWVKARLAPLVGTEISGSGPTDRNEAFTAWRTFLEAVASNGPLVLVVEDLHWADEAMLDFVEHLVDWSIDVPLLVLCTARPELYERHPGWGGGKRNSTTIGLSPLSGEEIARLIAALLAESELPAITQQALLERSGGNPLYAEEFVRLLLDRGIIQRSGHAVGLSPDPEVPVPDTVQALIAARLDTLSPERKALIQDASVIGKVFWSGAVVSMSGQDEEAVRQGLHDLSRKELIRPSRRSSIEGQAEYSFWHILVRDVAYEQIPRAARATKHAAAAEWIEMIAGERVSDQSELLAHHYVQALKLTRATGETRLADEFTERAHPFLVMAGDRAMGLDVAKAESYFESALALLPEQHSDRPAILAKAAEALWQLGHGPRAGSTFLQAIAGFESAGDLLAAGEAQVRLADVLWVGGETAEAEVLLAHAGEKLEALPPSRGLAAAYVLAARQRQWQGQSEDAALECATKAQAIADEIGAREQAVRARQFVGFARLNLGDPAGLEDLRDSLRLGLEWGLGVETALGYLNLGDWMWQVEGPAAGLDVHRAGIEFAERRGLKQAAMWTRAETTWTLFELGHWDELVRVADEVAAWERGHGGSQLRGIALACKARTMLLQGRVEEAVTLMEEVLPLARGVQDLQVLLPALGTAALVERTRGNIVGAVRLVEEWFELNRATAHWLRGLNLLDALAVFASAPALDSARTLLEWFAPRCAREECALVTGRAILHEAVNEFEDGARLYADAAERWKSFGHVPELGMSHLGAARCLLLMTLPAEASEHLSEAREVLAGIDARPLIAEVDLLQERASALTSS